MGTGNPTVGVFAEPQLPGWVGARQSKAESSEFLAENLERGKIFRASLL